MTDHPGSALVVDDDPVVLTVLQAALQAEGLEARTTDSVDAALAALSSWTPDLVLLDVRMPGRLGFELQHWLQQQPQNARIPVVFLTQHDSVEDRAWGLANGAVDFISKSFLAPSSIHLLALRVRNLVMVQESQGLRGALGTAVASGRGENIVELIRGRTRRAPGREPQVGIEDRAEISPAVARRRLVAALVTQAGEPALDHARCDRVERVVAELLDDELDPRLVRSPRRVGPAVVGLEELDDVLAEGELGATTSLGKTGLPAFLQQGIDLARPIDGDAAAGLP